jgi:Rrf2 family transcriptional regulator, iron-sulfur cluster assembly transcription factor
VRAELLNQSADYALRAVLFVAQTDARRSCNASAISKAIGVPRNYLGKVLHALTHAGVLQSVRGPQGGFRLAHDAERLTVADVVEPFQRLPQRRICLLGDRACDSSAPCVAHQHWQRITGEVTSFFRTTTIAALLSGAPALDRSARQLP